MNPSVKLTLPLSLVFKKGWNCCAAAVRERSEKIEEKQLCRHQCKRRRRMGMFPRCQSRDFPAAHGEDPGEAACPSAAHRGLHWSSRWICPEGGCSLRRAHAGAGGLAGTGTCEGPVLEQCPPEGLYPIKRTRARGVLEELWPVGRTHTGSSLRTVSCGSYTMLEQGNIVWGGRSGIDEVLWTDHIPMLHSIGRDARVRKEWSWA